MLSVSCREAVSRSASCSGGNYFSFSALTQAASLEGLMALSSSFLPLTSHFAFHSEPLAKACAVFCSPPLVLVFMNTDQLLDYPVLSTVITRCANSPPEKAETPVQ
jgi:hypothetical protein